MAPRRGRWNAQDIRTHMRLYAVTDRAWLNGRTLPELVADAIAGGATFIQLREKHATHDEIVALARELMPICHAAGVPFVIDDAVEIAREVGADGVHVGQSDTACADARRLLGDGAIIGVSVQTVEEARAAQAAGADYLGVGALIPTPTKPDAVDVTSEELARICRAVDIPVVGIGGLRVETLDVLANSGVDGAAVVSALFAADDAQAAARSLRARLDEMLGGGESAFPALPTACAALPAVLAIAGSDSSGGAGIQADIKTVAAHGLFAETAVTALTAQNTMGVRNVLEATPTFIAEQIDAIFEDIPPAAIKIGMCPSAPVIEAVADALTRWSAANIVLDPVMVATSGARLIAEDAVHALEDRLIPLARLITPNMPEAEVLAGFEVRDEKDQERAAVALADRFGCAVLVKGGHGVHDANDVLALPPTETADVGAGVRTTWLRSPRVDTENTHGTGCTLSSAIACGLARGLGLEESVAAAKSYLMGALEAGLNLGAGSGPIDHMWAYRPHQKVSV